MNSIDEVVRVAVVAGGRTGEQRLLRALAGQAIPGFRVDILDSGATVEPHHDLIHLLDATDALSIAAVAHEHEIGLVTAFPRLGLGARLILSPSAAADRQLLALGASPAALWRWQPGVDTEEFGPGYYREGSFGPADASVNVICVGDPAPTDLVLDAFALAARVEPRLRLHLIGAGPATKLQLGTLREAVSVIPAPSHPDLAALYASADLLLHADDDPEIFPQSIREAQASGLPVLALDTGAAPELIEDGRDGSLVPPTVPALAEALCSLARRAALRERLAVGGLRTVRDHSWTWSLRELAAAWTAALAPAGARIARAA